MNLWYRFKHKWQDNRPAEVRIGFPTYRGLVLYLALYVIFIGSVFTSVTLSIIYAIISVLA